MSIVILEHSPNFGAGILARGLRTLGSRLRIIRVDRGEALPPDLDGITGLVSCGGPQSAYGNEPWLAAEMSLIRDAHGAGVPVVGLCLGAQLLAQALGGEVKKSATPELGWFNVSLSPVGREDPVLAGIPWTSTQFCWHFDEIVTAPPEARILASSERCRVQAFAVGLFSYGFQYHFEWDRAIILKEVDEYGDEVRSAGASPEAIRSGVDQHAAVAERLAERLTERIALCLMPVDRVNRGIVRDLHH
ncbi:MAG: type 1 glutamine amidotransferase [Phycisphaeraceae bacterium]|nr:type 1 glutamine amidotransferase [Phycisphaeraceae bacterium]